MFGVSLLRFCRLIRLVRVVKVFRLRLLGSNTNGWKLLWFLMLKPSCLFLGVFNIAGVWATLVWFFSILLEQKVVKTRLEAHHQLVNAGRVVMGLPFVSGVSMESSKDDGRWKIHIRWTLSRKGSCLSGTRTHEWKYINPMRKER